MGTGIVSAQALIREMDSEELIDYVAGLADHPFSTTGEVEALVRLCCRQYGELNDGASMGDAPGVTIRVAAMVAACHVC